MEDSVTSSLNLFDIAVRLVPGALVLAACGFFSGWCSDICGDDAITLFLAFVASYTVGTLLRFLAWPLSELIHLIAYDGNPRTAIWIAAQGRAGWASRDAPSYEIRARVPLGSHAGAPSRGITGLSMWSHASPSAS